MLAALEEFGVKEGKWFNHNRWNSAYFAEQGLFSLAAAFA
jgi:hypothetical protein